MLTRLAAIGLSYCGILLCAAGPLRVVHAGVRQIEDGQAADSGVAFTPGETVYLSFDLENFAETQERKVTLSWTVQAADPKGVLIAPPADGKYEAALQPEDKDWTPRIRTSIVVPSPAPGGQYSIHLRVTDLNSKQDAESEIHFTVSGPDLPKAKALEILHFGFYRSEDEPQALSSATFHAGDTLFSRFRIAGYKYGDKNAIEVTYALTVAGPAGNIMYRQDPALEEKSSSFYPKPFIDTSMSLSLNPGTPAGEYVLGVIVRDRVANRTIETRNPFRID